MRDKLINKMRYAHQDCLCNADGTNEEAWEAALDALLGEPELLQQLLDLRK